MKKGLKYLLILLAFSLFLAVLAGCGSKKTISVQSGPTDPNYRGVIYQEGLQGPESGKPNI
ncbi:hypothetical protein MGLY_01680 [Neomoorella glycerini]|uniref:Prokaryotic membrane lipoprotein lipid attachment site profile n=1 Tax=Neomoorella glycerini TaxID=55779 RepID=A0A6I5ZM28_9FIRM|nr:hypothetical protein [Moorella glycerini]QGP90856.1 hypothetical protein MGLY_01680 [Moorella glycerini]